MNEQPVETTLYSLDETVPCLPERRHGERHLSLLRVGSLIVEGRRELCLIRNISAGGMLIRAYCDIAAGTPVEIELKQGEAVAGTARWTKDECVGVTFERPIDVLALLSSSEDGPRPRMPRVETDCAAAVRVDASVHRIRVVDISQGGLKFETPDELPLGAYVIVSLPGLASRPGMIRWCSEKTYGITFNRVIPLPLLVAWLHDQQTVTSAAG